MRKGDWPKTVEKKIEICQPEQLKRFCAACSEGERLLFQLFLFTEFRAMEIRTLTWSDINFRDGTVSVTPKADLMFMPKSYEERSVPVPRSVTSPLAARQKKSKSLPIFPAPPHPTHLVAVSAEWYLGDGKQRNALCGASNGSKGKWRSALAGLAAFSGEGPMQRG